MIPQEVRENLLSHPDVTRVGWGYKYKNGKRTPEKCILVGVKLKKPLHLIPRHLVIPRTMQGLSTDVTEKNYVAPPPEVKEAQFISTKEKKEFEARQHTRRMRPCPPGFSIGHVSITAGTLGAYVKKDGPDWWILSNNHVLADSNAGIVGDKVIQPGKADGGFSGPDLFAHLKDFVTINWENGNGGGGGCNLFARLWMKVKGVRAIEQPNPNLVDAALALPVNQGWVKTDYPDGVGAVHGMAELELGDSVKKVGRTTELTHGIVEGVDVWATVSYGTAGTARFQDQIEIVSGSESFSQGGDSGSAILTADNRIGGLLFAGSGSGPGSTTIANRISHVSRLLQVTL